MQRGRPPRGRGNRGQGRSKRLDGNRKDALRDDQQMSARVADAYRRNDRMAVRRRFRVRAVLPRSSFEVVEEVEDHRRIEILECQRGRASVRYVRSA